MSDFLFSLGNGVVLDLEYLADDIADDFSDDMAIEFIMLIDARKASTQFSEKLYATVGDSLRKELEETTQ